MRNQNVKSVKVVKMFMVFVIFSAIAFFFLLALFYISFQDGFFTSFDTEIQIKT